LAITLTSQDYHDKAQYPIRKYTIAWTSDGSGDASDSIGPIIGAIQRVVFAPGAGGSQPTDNYDVTITDESGIDILAGQGADLDNATTTHVKPGVPFTDGTIDSVDVLAVSGMVTVTIDNAGDTKSGTIVIYAR
jgi:hypothetical protein